MKSKINNFNIAPTPQNTPSSTNGLCLKNKENEKTISVENLEKTEDIKRTSENTSSFLSVIQGKLGGLVGQKSGYVDGLSFKVKQRILALKNIQNKQMKFEALFQKELLDLEKKYFSKYDVLYDRRRLIINGDENPTKEELEDNESFNLDSTNDFISENEKLKNINENLEESGIPDFWLTCFKNLPLVSETISERDYEVLYYLKDLRMKYLESPGFVLFFEFRENPFFSNKVLTKKYHYQAELDYSGEFVYDYAEGCEIEWKSNQHNVTINFETKKQKNKKTNQTRTIEKITPEESFFNFFDPPRKLNDDDNLSDDENHDLPSKLELDYNLGEEFKDKLIPRAIDWFTGDAQFYQYESESDELISDINDTNSETEYNDDYDDVVTKSNINKKQDPSECKQQ